MQIAVATIFLFQTLAMATTPTTCADLLEGLNNQYFDLHVQKEEAFWKAYMGTSPTAHEELNHAEARLTDFASDPRIMDSVRQALEDPSISEHTRVGLEGWMAYFDVAAVPSEIGRQEKIYLEKIESALQKKRDAMVLKFLAADGTEVTGSTNKLALLMSTANNERDREGAYSAIRKLEKDILDIGFLELVKQRNKFAQSMGYPNFYAYKLKTTEGMTLPELFETLDELELETRETAKKYVDQQVQKYGEKVLDPWNFSYLTRRNLTERLDPYFPPEESLYRWAATFQGLGINYQRATVTLDLVDRPGQKYSNGFMHGVVPTLKFKDGSILPAEINFSSNMVPGQVGAGLTSLKTLFHEGGHAAHFANIEMPALSHAQEFAPSSVAVAELQSKFMDALLHDPLWLRLYAKDRLGNPMPPELIEEYLLQVQSTEALNIRNMLLVPYAERWLYEASDSELTPENIRTKFLEIARRLTFLNGAQRPILSVPHLLSSDSSGYYQGYILADMAVAQTQAHFRRSSGNIVNETEVGRLMREKYWKPGNRPKLDDFLMAMTSLPLVPYHLIKKANTSEEAIKKEVRLAMEMANQMHVIPKGDIYLNAYLRVVHGHHIIAEGAEFHKINDAYARWQKTLQNEAKK